jgi:hypothetical protein
VEIIRRKAEARARFPGGHTFFDEKIAPRLTKVRLGPRLIGFTDSSIERLIGELIEESKNIVPAPRPTAEQQRAARERKPKRRSK